MKKLSIQTKFGIALAFIFIFLLVLEYVTPKETDWSLSFSKDHKSPFGSYVVHELLPDMFPKSVVTPNERSFFESLTDSVKNKNLIVISFQFNPDEFEASRLLRFVRRGNNAFIAADEFSSTFYDSLKFLTEYNWSNAFYQSDSLSVNFVNPKLKTDSGYVYESYIDSYYIKNFDTLNSVVLGKNSDGHVNYIRVPYGNGNFYICSQPFAFTNYSMVKKNHLSTPDDTTINNAEYVSKLLSYLPDNDIIWDEYYKPFRGQSDSTLRYILSSTALKASFVTLIIGLLVYTVFEAKRKQRIIPIVKSPPNTSLEFIQTVGRLYFHSGRHTDLAQKKVLYLTEYLRSRYYLHINNFDADDQQRTIEKTGADTETVKNLFAQARLIKEGNNVNQSSLLSFHRNIEEFHRSCK